MIKINLMKTREIYEPVAIKPRLLDTSRSVTREQRRFDLLNPDYREKAGIKIDSIEGFEIPPTIEPYNLGKETVRGYEEAGLEAITNFNEETGEHFAIFIDSVNNQTIRFRYKIE